MQSEIITALAHDVVDLTALAKATYDTALAARYSKAAGILSRSMPVMGLTVGQTGDIDADLVAADLDRQFHALCDAGQYDAAHVVNDALTVLTLVD